MHRLSPTLSPKSLAASALALVMLATGLTACGGAKLEVADPPLVEKLRLRITKVRNAIDETRQTIAVSRGAPYLAELYVRLAELMSEEARYHYQVAYERENRSSEVLHAPQVRFLKETAIGVYRRVLKNYPNSGLSDRILFNIGHEQRELATYDDMIATLNRLVDEYPDSLFRPEALLVLGDYYFDKADLGTAERYYREITKGKLSPVTGLGHYKLAWVWVNRAECKRALVHFEKGIDESLKWVEVEKTVDEESFERPATGQDIDVRREALVDMAYCYTQERKSKGAVAYIRDKAYNRATYIAALERFARRYGVTNEERGAIDVGRELLRLAPDHPDRLDDARMLYTALKRVKEFGQIGTDARMITEAMLRQSRRTDTDDELHNLMVKEFEVYVRDLLTQAQGKFQETDSVAGRMSVAEGYAAYLEAFPDSENRKDILLNLADVLSEAQVHLDSGRRYLQAAEILEEEDKKRTALYDAIVEFQSSLAGDEARGYVERVVARSLLRSAAQQLLVFKLDQDKERKVKFAVAQTYYDEGRYRDAIDRLSAVAYEFPQSEQAGTAIHLVLDSFNVVNDYDGLIAAGHRFLDTSSPASPQIKMEIKPIVDAAEQRKLDEISLQAAGDEGGDLSALTDFADRFAGTKLGERALVNAFVAARAVGDSDALYKLGQDLAAKYPQSEQLPGIASTLAQNAMAAFEFDRAVGLYRNAAQSNPGQKSRLLVTAAQLHEQLGNMSAAVQTYQEALAASEPAGRAIPAGYLAAALEKQGNDGQTISVLQPLGITSPEVSARLGLAMVRSGMIDAAEMTLQQVLQGAEGATADMIARAHYGMAEAVNAALASYVPEPTVDSVQELVALIEVTEQAYLNAARQGDPMITAAALSRLAAMSNAMASRLQSAPMPSDLPPDEQVAVKEAFAERAKQLQATAKEAMGACAEQAWKGKVFNPVVRGCLKGSVPAKDPLAFDRLKPRTGGAQVGGLEELKARLAKNPNDAEALREVGIKFLDKGDPHTARLIFARAAGQGGPEDLNLLGIASMKIGDFTGGLEAFAQAAEAGLEAGRQNLAKGLRQLGLNKAADEVNERLPEGKEGGRSL